MSDSHYIDNKQFFAEMVKWKKQVVDAEETDDPKPPVTEYIGQCFLLIADRLSTRPNFVNYPFRDEMIGDAIENCLMYASNFDPEKSKNPFAYFTQITYYAFLRRIQREKKQDHIKYKLMEAADAKGELAAMLDPEGATKNPYAAHLRLTDNDIVNMEPKKKGRKKKKKNSTDGELF
jgi:hypothetical protein